MAKVVFQDEEGQNLNRYLITPTDGSAAFTADLTRAGTITKQGTPYDKEVGDHFLQVEDGTPVQTLACSKAGTVYVLTGLTATAGLISCVFKADADYAGGDTFTVNGTAVTAVLQTGDNLDDGYFKAGTVVQCAYDIAGAKLNFKVGISTPSIFGDGSDGAVTISSNTTLPVTVSHQSMVEKKYKSLTINSGVTLKCASWNAGLIIRVRGDCIIHGTIDQSGLSPKTNPQNTYPYPAQLVCGNGGNGYDGGTTSSAGPFVAMLKRSYGGGYGAGGGGGDGRYGGAGGHGGDSNTIDVSTSQMFIGGAISTTASISSGKFGGGGAGGGSSDDIVISGGNSPGGNGHDSYDDGWAGAGGGAGNYGGGVVLLYVGGNLTIDGYILCNGLPGGKGGSKNATTGYGQAGSGGGGGGGGAIYLLHKGTYVNTGVMQVNGGAGGAKGTPGTGGLAAKDGAAGGVGSITAILYTD